MADSARGKFRGLLDAGERVAPTAAIRLNAILSDWRTAYEAADADTDAYWDRVARELTWIEPWRELRVEDGRNHTEWFAGSRCNITQNVLDRHLEGANRTKTALIWVSEEGEERRFTFEELARFVNRFANVLRQAGVKKGGPGLYLHAADARRHDSHVGLRSHRRHPLSGVRGTRSNGPAVAN